MGPGAIERVLRKQDEILHLFAEAVLQDLTREELTWKPAPGSWTVTWIEGGWVPDWEVPEPADLPPPTLAWQVWHCSWWLSMVLDHSFGEAELTRETFEWEGPHEGIAGIVRRHERWQAHCSELPPEAWDSEERVGWPFTDGAVFLDLAAWANVELTKNLAEMALTRSFRRARPPDRADAAE